MKRRIYSVLLVGALVGPLVASCGFAETPGERFQKAIEQEAKYCATHKIERGNTRCDITKLKPADPLANEEGRFAHSITIPNPLPDDSGYTPGMTPEQYFDHLCKTEAGEFIYKTVENVEGIYQMRPRQASSARAATHLYALEDPYGELMEGLEVETLYVKPSRYKFIETSELSRRESEDMRKYRHSSYFDLPTHETTVARYFGYDGQRQISKQKEFDSVKRSHQGYTWRGVSRPHDRELGIAGSELIILDLKTHTVLAVHRGYAKFEIDERYGTSGFQWGKRCPEQPNESGGAPVQFILKVLKPKSQVQ